MKHWFVISLMMVQGAVGGAESWWVAVEGGPTWQSTNDARIPGTTGTRFALTDFGTGPFWTARWYLGYRASDVDEFRGLVAPLTVGLSGSLAQNVQFVNTLFPAGSTVGASYTFNSYRLTYKRRMWSDASWEGWLGFTAKIRDARIALTNNGVTTESTNVGFVPLIHGSVGYRLGPTWTLGLDFDAIWSPYGRAEDIWAGTKWELSPSWNVSLGYRMVEGGSDVSAVYTFAWLHFLSMGVRFDF